MQKRSATLHLSATDLSNHLACRHLTQLDRLVAEKKLEAPARYDPMLEVLRERGFRHEKAYLDLLRAERGLSVAELGDVGSDEKAFERTKAAMSEGAQAIAQAVLLDGRWGGRADLLLRVERPSELGAWSYEVVDTKLASETRGGTVLQIGLYSDLVARIQGRLPDWMHVVTPGQYAEPQTFRTCDFMAYCRLIRRQLEAALADGADGDPTTYPEPVPHCDVCRWWSECTKRRREDDHLSRVAGLGRLHQRELQAREIGTMAKLATLKLPLDPKPKRGSLESYERGHHQARLQVASNGKPRPVHEVVDAIGPGRGLARLPEPSPGDIFLDLEGDPFVESGGREYLFGWVVLDGSGKPGYHRIWALDPESERRAFEEAVDTFMARWDAHPDLHIYHFHHYEPAAFKRLMGRYATREEAVDRLLRGGRFIDLHGVVRQGIRVGVERYTLKDLEPLHDFRREQELREASKYLRGVERLLELGESKPIPEECVRAVEAYNREDCVSTWSLRNWLEGARADEIARGKTIPRAEPGTGEPPEQLDERQRRIQDLFERLTEGVSPDPSERSAEDQARWLLAHLLDWHRREGKATWWEYFRLCELSEDELRDERSGLGGLELVERVGGTDRCPIHRYRFPPQDHDVRAGQKLHTKEGLADAIEIGDVQEVDNTHRTIEVKKRQKARDLHPKGVFVHDYIKPWILADSIESVAEWVAENGIDAEGEHRAARDLLLNRPPRLVAPASGSLCRKGEELNAASRRLALELAGGVLPVQGPPGSGKTYMGARMICELVRAGKKVGVTAVSHKVIRNLLDEVLKAAREKRIDLHCVQKPGEFSEEPPEGLSEVAANEQIRSTLMNGEAQVAGGTAWAWASDELEGLLDVLVVDEAGQMSLANTIAASRSARSLILLGDPQQLEQPIQGTHPEGSDASALEHLLGKHETMPDHCGLFLAETWRLHPDICAFTSEIFYENRLRSRPGRERQRIVGPTPFAGAGLWLVPAEHEGNQSSSLEEVDAVERVVRSLLVDGVSWINPEGQKAVLRPEDVLIVAPYNAQVALLSERLPGMRVGTVDKFQGQEAPIVIYSVTTSSADEAPRGMEFLYSLHRLNVATSRARCASILVASARVLEPECRTPQQMRLANALCRYAELAMRPSAAA